MQNGDVMTMEDLFREASKIPETSFRLERKEDVRLSVDVQSKFAMY